MYLHKGTSRGNLVFGIMVEELIGDLRYEKTETEEALGLGNLPFN